MGEARDAAVEVFASRVRTLKEGSGRSYGALARRLNVSTSTLYRYCSGETVPEQFTVVDRLARLCGADDEEREDLRRAWERADGARRRTPEPKPAETAQPDAAPEPAPTPTPDPEPEPAPVRGRFTSRFTPATRVALFAGAAAAATALVATLLGLGPSSAAGSPDPTVTEQASRQASQRAPKKAAEPPFTWTASSHVWQNGCGHTYVSDRGPQQVLPPPPAQDAVPWTRTHGAVHGGSTLVRISLQGRSPTTAVVLQALHVRVTDRAEPLAWNAYRMDNGCGGAVTPRTFDVNLDAPRPLARSVAGYDGLADRKIPAVSLPYTVTSSAPEELLVTARTAGCDCRWYLELEWSSEGRSGTVRITDDGRPFRTSGIEGRPVFEYDTLNRRWITGEVPPS